MMFLFAVLRYKALEWEDYKFPAWSISVGWLLTASSICFVPGYIVIAFLKTRGTMKQDVGQGSHRTTVAASGLQASPPFFMASELCSPAIPNFRGGMAGEHRGE
ncbi:hypothetical protein HPB52_004853 [Rhipicephalus sanguineus]|uniref:Uncharacterized protein n=1 Tax=Rhipicephalus sanguineus TaxID=34632 RepID=A0A9D4SXQ8_RHISA|nr:hypothetical protein HPB52_004853 [Rhipicephalus sanguineus]